MQVVEVEVSLPSMFPVFPCSNCRALLRVSGCVSFPEHGTKYVRNAERGTLLLLFLFVYLSQQAFTKSLVSFFQSCASVLDSCLVAAWELRRFLWDDEVEGSFWLIVREGQECIVLHLFWVCNYLSFDVCSNNNSCHFLNREQGNGES